MDIDYSEAKDFYNNRKHGVSLSLAQDFDMASAVIEVDDREDYGEVRYNALGFINARLYSLTFTVRDSLVRAISLRKATKQESKNYADLY